MDEIKTSPPEETIKPDAGAEPEGEQTSPPEDMPEEKQEDKPEDISPEKPKKKKKTKKQKLIASLVRFLVKLAALTLTAYVLLTFVIGVFVNHSNDMYPSVRDGDLVITLRLKDSVYGDVVAYTVNGTRHFGRVVAMAGDEVYIDNDGRFTVNGYSQIETIYYLTRPAEGGITFPYTVQEGELFVLNDLRDNVTDSRTFGAIPEKNVEGSIVLSLRRRGF